MTDFVDTALRQINERLDALKAEITRLATAPVAGGDAPEVVTQPAPARRGPGRPPGRRGPGRPPAGRGPGRPAGRRGGTRANQALELVQQQPGITIGQLAATMKIHPNYLYRVMPGLEQSGQVKRNGSGWYVA